MLGLTRLLSVCPQSGRGTMNRSRLLRGAANASSATTQPTHTRRRLTTSPASVRLRSSQTFDVRGASLVPRGCGVVCRQSHTRAGRRRVVDGCAWQERWLQDDRLGAADHRQQSPLQVSPRLLVSERSRAKDSAPFGRLLACCEANLRDRCTGSMAAGGGAKIRSFSLHSGERPAGRRSLAEEMEGGGDGSFGRVR